MAIRKNFITPFPAKAGLVLLLFLLIQGCSPVARLYLGIKTPKIYHTTDDRTEYYKPFLNSAKAVRIYALRDTVELYRTFNDFSKFPQIYLREMESDKWAIIDCFDDITPTVKDLNEGNKVDLKLVEPEDSKRLIVLFDSAKPNIETSGIGDKTQPRWEAYIISGVFLGKKLKKRMLPVIHLDQVREINIVDLSVAR